MEKIILACIIIHNMLIDEAKEPRPPPTRLPFEIQVTPPDPHAPPLSHTEIQFRRMDMQSALKHAYLMEDLVSVQWSRLATQPVHETESRDDETESGHGSSSSSESD